MLEFYYRFLECRADSPDCGVGELQNPEGLGLGNPDCDGEEHGERGFGVDVTTVNCGCLSPENRRGRMQRRGSPVRILGAPSTGQRGTESRRGMPSRGRTGRKGVPERGTPGKSKVREG